MIKKNFDDSQIDILANIFFLIIYLPFTSLKSRVHHFKRFIFFTFIKSDGVVHYQFSLVFYSHHLRHFHTIHNHTSYFSCFDLDIHNRFHNINKSGKIYGCFLCLCHLCPSYKIIRWMISHFYNLNNSIKIEVHNFVKPIKR